MQKHPVREAMARRRAAETPEARVVIAGGGVGGVEAALALREALGGRVTIELVAPTDAFVYQPLTVQEPFGAVSPHRVPLARLVATHGVVHRRAAIAAIDPEHRHVELEGGELVGYDALVVATGARPEPWLEGALHFAGAGEVEAYRALLERVRAGEVREVLFAVPHEATWPLGLYDLALLTAAWAQRNEIAGLRLALATPEAEPLGLFGPAASRAVRDVLARRGIELRTGATDAAQLAAQAVVTLPRLRGEPIAGLPRDDQGFVPTGAHGAVEGLAGIYAVGDATSFSIKQGGLAAQQADAAADAIAARLGGGPEPEPFEPVLRGFLLTGVTALHLSAGAGGDPAGDATVAHGPLWWPPTKVAGRHLGAFLAEQDDLFDEPELELRGPGLSDPQRSREELRRRALHLAHADADAGDPESALRWLATLEWLDGGLDAEHAALREQWSRAPR